MRRMLTISLILVLTMLSAGELYAQKAQRFRGIQLIGPTSKNQNAQKNQGVALLAPPNMTSSYSLVFPQAQGSTGQVLSRGSGDNLAWVSLTDQSWSIIGNSTVDSTQNFIGTTNTNANAPLIFKTDGDERMRITGGAGWVGIGVANPAALLDVNGTMRVGGNATLAGTVTMSSVAAGTASDDVLLINASNQITKVSRASLLASGSWSLTGNATTTNGGTLGSAPSVGGNFIGTTDARTLSLATNNVIQVQIATDGVMSTNKDAVINTVTFGMGAGAIASNTAAGRGALAANTTGANNVAVGRDALLSNTDGYRNVAVGLSALQSNTSGYSNQAIGFEVLRANQSGYMNTAMGLLSLTANTTGYQNVALGAWSMYTNTTGQQHTAIGVNALYSNTTSLRNTAVGSSAMFGNTTGSMNTAIGGDALYSNVAGGENVAVGTRALYTVNASSNTAVGADALYFSTTATTNTAVGFNAQKSNTTGGNNVSIGAQSLRDNQTGTSNVAIGYQAGFSETGSSKLYIANSFSNNLIYGDFSTGVLSINAGTTPSAPGASLQVNAFNGSTKGMIVKGGASQSANLLELQNSAGTVLMFANSDGTLSLNPRGTAAGNTNELRFAELAANGTNYVGLKAADAITANTIWTLPNADGTNGQVLSTNGTGVMSWTTVNGLQYFTETLFTLAPNDTKNAVQWKPKTTTANVDIVLSPLGNGALLGRVPDGTATGGNKRGSYAVDLQLVGGSAATNVASGSYSTITGGRQNTASSSFAFVGGGSSNIASGQYAAIAGGDNNIASADYSAVIGGASNTASQGFAAVMGGESNTASGTSSSITGGLSNTASGNYTTVLGGFGLTLSGRGSVGFNSANATLNNLMSVSSDGTMALGNTNLWLANNDNTARELRFYEAQNTTGVFPAASTNYTALKAGTQSADITYTLPTAAPTTNGQVLSSTTGGVMSWSTALTATSGWSTTGNTGLNSSTNFLGTTDSVDLVFRHTNTERLRLSRHGIRVVQNGTPRSSQWAASFQNIGGPIYLELLNSDTVTNGGGMYMGMRGTGSVGDTATIWNWQGGPLAFYTASTNRAGFIRLMVDNDGDVGIGSHIPTQRLHVRGGNVLIDTVGSTSGQLLFRNPQGTASTGIRAGFQTSDITYWLPASAPSVNGQVLTANTAGVMEWANIASQSWSLTGNASTSASTNFIGTTDPVDVVFRRDNTERARITNAGLRVVQNGTPRSSVWTLSVQNITSTNASTVIEFLNSTAAVNGGGAFVGLNGNGAIGDTLGIWNHQGGPIEFQTGTANRSNVPRMRIEPNGNVGIGNTIAGTLLDVDGAITVRPPATIAVVADNQAVTVGNRSSIVLESNGLPANRTITLSNGLQTGQILFIAVTGTVAANGIEIVDDPAGANTNLSGLAQLVDGAVLQLLWNGTDWLEVSRSNN